MFQNKRISVPKVNICMLHDKRMYGSKINICVLCGFEYMCCYEITSHKIMCVIKNMQY